MIGKILILMASFLVFATSSFGFGGVVTDPVSYGYFAEQITAAGEQLKKTTDVLNKAKEQVENLKVVQNKVQGVGNQLKGHYDRAKGLVDKVKGVREKLEKTPTTLQGQYAKWKNLDFIDPQKALEEFFEDPRANNANLYKALDRRYEVRQMALKNSIMNAEVLLQAAPGRMKVIEGLSGQIDGTENVKDAADLNNRIMIEMWTAVEEIKMLLAHLAEAQGLMNFSGVSKEVTTARVKTVDEHSKRSKKGPMDDYLEAHGFDPKVQSNDDLRKSLGI